VDVAVDLGADDPHAHCLDDIPVTALILFNGTVGVNDVILVILRDHLRV
jgi:hypothetical protein